MKFGDLCVVSNLFAIQSGPDSIFAIIHVPSNARVFTF